MDLAGPRRDQLHGDALGHFAVHALGQIHRAHAPAPYYLKQPVRPATPSFACELRQRLAGRDTDVPHQESARAGIEFEQRLYLAADLGIDPVFGQILRAGLRRQIRQRMKYLLDFDLHPAISLRSQACATRNSRRTVCTDISSTAADSSAVIPPK